MEKLREIASKEHFDQAAFAIEYTEAQYDVIMALLDENHNLATLVAELYEKDNVPATGVSLPAGTDRNKLH